MRREGGRPVAARRRPESSGFNKTFPHGGNDIRGGIGSVWHGRSESGSLLVPRPALLGGLFQTCLRQAGAALPRLGLR